MRILLTNDDGIESPGLHALRHAFGQGHEVWIVAPDTQRSACAQAITLRSAIRTKQIDAHEFSCSGTPVDCVNLAFVELMPDPPDLVISGINLGPNIGTDIGYSGTAAAARQGAFRGIPSIAVSVFSHGPTFHFGAALAFLERYVQSMVDKWRTDFFYNVNAPDTDSEVLTVSVCTAADTKYTSITSSFDAPGGERYHFYSGERVDRGVEKGTDLYAALKGEIAVSCIQAVPTVSPTPSKLFAEN